MCSGTSLRCISHYKIRAVLVINLLATFCTRVQFQRFPATRFPVLHKLFEYFFIVTFLYF